MAVNTRLRSARVGAGYASAAAAAKAFGWSIGTYACHENGSRGVTVEAAKRYAAAFQVDLSWLLYASVISPEQRAAADAALRKIIDAPQSAPAGAATEVPADAPATDRTISEIVAALADEYEALNERGRQSLTVRFWSAFPDLRERAIANEGRRLARLVGG